jgi:hypothetical protein
MPARGLIIGAYGSGFFGGAGSVPRDGAALAGFNCKRRDGTGSWVRFVFIARVFALQPRWVRRVMNLF